MKFHFEETIPFRNFINSKEYFLSRADSWPNDAATQTLISRKCNQPLIYQFLFKEKFKGRPYAQSDAKDFMSWAHKGWAEQSYFVFFIADHEQQIVGTLDIKSNSTKSAEVGFWSDAETPGNLSNALLEMIHVAKATGFNKFHAYALPNNLKSVGVLQRTGFIEKLNRSDRDSFLYFERD